MGLQNLSFHCEIFKDSKINKENKIFYSDFFLSLNIQNRTKTGILYSL